MNDSEPKAGRKKMPYFFTVFLLISHLCFFYLFAVDLRGVFYSIAYMILVAGVPGFLLSAAVLKIFSNSGQNKIETLDTHLILSISVLLGIANILFCYLLSRLINVFWVDYIFLWPVVILAFKSGRSAVSRCNVLGANRGQRDQWFWPILLLFSLLFSVYFFAMRPTPGIVTVEIFHDHLWNAGNTVSLMSDFPLKSMRIETMPYLSYHILVHILGAHMAILTGLTPHLVGLQYVFIPLIPIFIYSMMALIAQFFRNDNLYLIYGLAVLLFGGGFRVVHDVKVVNLLGSTNFLGVILLFLILTITFHLRSFTKFGRFLLMFTGLFLATVAKGTIGIALCGGVGLWWLYQLYKKNFSGGYLVDVVGAGSGFLSSYYLFFVWPVIGQHFKNTVVQGGSFPLVPLGYVTNNALMAGFVELVKNYLSGIPQLAAHILLTLLILPLYVLLYYSYRLLVVYYFRAYEVDEAKQRTLFFALSSLLIGYSINVPYAQNYAYFITVAVFCLDILFVVFVQQEQAFAKIAAFVRERAIYSVIGLVFIIILPFVDLSNIFFHEHSHNYIFTGKIGQLLNQKLENTTYRKTQQNITPEMYKALDFIRRKTPKETIVVSTLVNTPDGRPRAFYASTFSERTAFIEGYFQIEGLAKYADPDRVKANLTVMENIFTNYDVPAKMRNEKYVYLCKIEDVEKFQEKYTLKLLYQNSSWAVMYIV